MNYEIHFLDREGNHRGDLFIRKSEISGVGLFTSVALRKDQSIGLWTGRPIPISEYKDDKFGMEYFYHGREDATVVLTPVDDVSNRVDFSKHPFAAANEPTGVVGNSAANMYPRPEEFLNDDGRMCMLMVFYAAVDIPAMSELLWNYGSAFKRDYPHGGPAKSRDPPHNEKRLVKACRVRSDIAYVVPETPDVSSEEEWEGS